MKTFAVDWPRKQIGALCERLAEAHIPPAPEGASWALGCDREFLLRFRDYWIEQFDWDAAMARLNRYPQFIAEVDGLPIHFIHVRADTANARPLLLTHGWPGSYFEFWDVIELLTKPSQHGGLAKHGLDLVIPSLPGYAFSGKPAQPIGPKATSDLWNRLMTEHLGYLEYLAQGGDWGSLVTANLGLYHANAVRGIHLNMVALQSQLPPQDDAEKAWMHKAASAQQMLGGYSMVQMRKPMSLAYAAAGNPLGQAAWILERFHDWSDLSDGDLESVFGLDHLVTNISLYIMSGSFESSLWFYNGLVREGGGPLPAGSKCSVPLGIAAFPSDALLPVPPRSRVELVADNLMHWTDMPSGGHFAAMEKPAMFAADVIDWASKVWPTS